ncbi:MAG: PspA/IM30 family protein [Chloroflexi bacterium]|nr:PspA/IM30 family protein [Chloroflexota bacterium]
MGILERTTQILRANINDLLNSAEDPEKLLNQIMRDMEDALDKGKAQVAEQIAQEKMLQNDLNAAKKNADEWEQKAELALSKGREDLAREALRRQADYEEQEQVYGKQLEAQKTAVQKLKADLDALDAKYQDARSKKDTLIARAKRVRAEQQIKSASAKLSAVDYSSDLARMERRIQEQEARAAASEELAKSSMDDEFDQLGANDEIEKRLAALKQKMGK